MQPSRFSGFPTVYPSFQRHRKSIDHSRFPLNLSLSFTNNSPVWASLPTPPMSGSPPPEPLKDPSQLAGRRRKRSDTPPSTTATPTFGALPALVEHTAQRYGEQPASEQRREESSMQIAPQPVHYLPPLTYGAGPGALIAQYPAPELPSTQQQVSPRATRKTKAHVASACINCKKKHLRCDNNRPCRRCVQSGKEDTCRDVEHKKRGRPPLKPEDPTVIGRRAPLPSHLSSTSQSSGAAHGADPRGYAAQNYPPILPNAPPSIYGHHRSGSRTSMYGGLPSQYAAPSIAPSPMTVTAGPFSYATRPHSTSSTTSVQPPSPYISHPSYQNQGMPRQVQSYGGYPFHPVDVPPSTQPLYSNPIFPREQMPPLMQHGSQYGQGLQLPPIRPAQQSVIDPSISGQNQPAQQPSRQEHNQRQGGGERDPKRPKMDIQGILGPRND